MSDYHVFNRAGPYEHFVGRWSRRLAPIFLAWLGVPGGAKWLDVGCGTGALIDAILAGAGPAKVMGIDPSADFVEHARATIHDPRASFAVGDAMQLEFGSSEFDVAAAALVLNLVPDPAHAAKEMLRVVRGGGVAGAYVWDYAGEMRMIRVFWDAAVELDPTAAKLDQGARFRLCNPPELRACFESAGFVKVEVRSLDCDMRFVDFDDYWTPFLGGQGLAPAYAMSLDESERARLRDLISSRLPIEAGGGIHIVSRAWAVKGVVPAA